MESRVEGSTTAGEAPGVTADKVVNELKALIHRAEQQAAEREQLRRLLFGLQRRRG